MVASFLEMAAQSNARPEFLKAPVRFPKLSNSIVAQASRRAFHVSRPARKASMEEKKARYSTGVSFFVKILVDGLFADW